MDDIQVNSPQVEADLAPTQSFEDTEFTTVNCYISGGRGGRGGGGGIEGGNGGTGEGPTMNFDRVRSVNFINNAPHKTRKASDFRKIRLGDLDLREEKGVGRTVGAVSRNRRVYAARVHGRKRPVTAAVYEGVDAKEKWLEEVKKYEGLRLPTLVQVFGIVKSKQLYATVYEDDLIPIAEFRQWYSDSEISSHLFEYYVDKELHGCKHYLKERNCFSDEYTLWIRGTTKHLCVELSDSDDWTEGLSHSDNLVLHPPTEFTGMAQETIWMSCFELEEFHDVMVIYADGDPFCLPVSPHHLCRPGAILFLPDLDMDLYRNYNETRISPGGEVAHIPELQFNEVGWMLHHQYCNIENICKFEMGNGWIRFWFPHIPAPCKDLIWKTILSADSGKEPGTAETAWFTQANHIFSGYGIKDDLDSYAFINETSYWVSLLDSGCPPAETTLSDGIFLFLSPIGAMQNRGLRGLVYPFPMFWSLEPSGSPGLLPEEATVLGLPTLSVRAELWGTRWSTEIYCGLVEFYRRKGFDPYSLDVALHLELPLYQPSLHDGVYPRVQLLDEEEETDSDSESV
ncbi:hypothetical protein B0H11DRAFT_2424409 [Mycena galericulata]|nr:hypothetical protein B0H11DRAFT_2424409 [Mycena galericulata]